MAVNIPDGPAYNDCMNRLATQTSPYLQQHADNPVHWQPWDERALAQARAQHKPILLSIGYAACHWCHVMSEESFEDDATARLMNEHFINIKVDREERPDLDRIYQIAHQMLAQRGGGWPLTMFLTPQDQRPFFGGTYFPDKPRHGLPAFKDILQRVAAYYRQHGEEIKQQSAALDEAFSTLNPPPSAGTLTAAPLEKAREMLADEFDRNYGGFGGAPKFPHPAMVEFLLRQWRASAEPAPATGAGVASPQSDASAGTTEPDLHALYMATLTLRRMGEGGLFDQLGGGFCRYSVDRYWMVPHFEKMLYDNGALLAVYSHAAAATGDAFYADIAISTADWALREMCSPDGGFYSSLDADSEGHEGRFYVWDKAEVRQLLTDDEYRLVEARYGLNRVANFEDRWHLHVFESLDSLAQSGGTPQTIAAILDGARQKLLAARERRIRPARDEKVLTSWNALMIRGLSIAARALQRDDYGDAAARALGFIKAHLWRDGRLLASAKEGQAHLPAYLDDYAFLADAILELQQYRWNSTQFAWAVELVECMLAHFADKEAGGFYFTADDHERLMHRSRFFGDDATPNGNAVAAQVLNRLGILLGDSRYLQAAEGTLKAGWAPLERYPQAHATLLIALEEQLYPLETVIIRGEGAEAQRWRRMLTGIYAPRRTVLMIPPEAAGLAGALADKSGGTGRVVAYVCRGLSCLAPVESFEGLLALLEENKA